MFLTQRYGAWKPHSLGHDKSNASFYKLEIETPSNGTLYQNIGIDNAVINIGMQSFWISAFILQMNCRNSSRSTKQLDQLVMLFLYLLRNIHTVFHQESRYENKLSAHQ